MVLNFVKEAIENCPKAEPKIELEGFEPISQGEYHQIKRVDPKNCHSYTARVGHHYFKKKPAFPIIFEDDFYRIEIHKNLDNKLRLTICWKREQQNFYFDKSLPLLTEAVKKYMELLENGK